MFLQVEEVYARSFIQNNSSTSGFWIVPVLLLCLNHIRYVCFKYLVFDQKEGMHTVTISQVKNWDL